MISASELEERRAAYEQAMQNLRYTCAAPFTQDQYPDRYFHYGEGGRGLILSHGLVYVSSEAAEEIRAVDGPIVVGKSLYLEDPKFRPLHGALPYDAMVDVIKFTRTVRDHARRQLYSSVSSRRRPTRRTAT